jgi:hypothetical protein
MGIAVRPGCERAGGYRVESGQASCSGREGTAPLARSFRVTQRSAGDARGGAGIRLCWRRRELGAGSDGAYGQKISVPGHPLRAFDISWVDSASGHYYLADRSNAAIDVVDVAANKLTTQIGGFVGNTGKNDTSGPDGVITTFSNRELWAGDADSTVKVIDLTTDKIVAPSPPVASSARTRCHTTRKTTSCSSPTMPMTHRSAR